MSPLSFTTEVGWAPDSWRRFKPKGEVKNTQASISDFDAILPAFEGIDTVVHMSHDADYEALDMSGTHNAS